MFCSWCDAAYCNSKDLAKRTISDKILKERAYEIDKILRNKAFNTARNTKYDRY